MRCVMPRFEVGELIAIGIEHKRRIADDRLPCCRSESIAATRSDTEMSRRPAISFNPSRMRPRGSRSSYDPDDD